MSDAVVATTARPRQGAGVLQRFLDRYLLIVYTILAVIYLMLPVALIILFSFNNPAGKANVTWQGFTLKYWLNPLGVERAAAGGRPEHRDRGPVHPVRDGAGHADRAGPRALRLPRPAGRRTR